MQKIIPYLWFDTQAKEAAAFYIDTFGGDSQILASSTLNDTPSGSVDTVNFTVWGQEIGAISAGPYFKFTPALSLSAQCTSEEEIDRISTALTEGGSVLMELGWYPWDAKYVWLQDKFGVSWQLNFSKDQSTVTDRIAPAFMFIGENAGKAEEAIQFYTSIFPESSINLLVHYEEGQSPSDKAGTVHHAEFSLYGHSFMAIDSGYAHAFTFTEAVSLMVRCKDQAELDRYWEKLSAVPEAEQCGWLKDKYGVSWQIVPEEMDEMMKKGTPEQIARVTKAFLQMKKFDIATLQKAYAGEG